MPIELTIFLMNVNMWVIALGLAQDVILSYTNYHYRSRR